MENRLNTFAAHVTPSIAVPSRFSERAAFAKLGWMGAGAKPLIGHCKRFVEASSRQKNLFLKSPLVSGPSGTGKTHVLYATARALCEAVRTEIERQKSALLAEAFDAIERGDWTRYSDIERSTWAPEREVLFTTGAEIAHELRDSVQKHAVSKVVRRFRQEEIVRRGGVGILFVDDLEIMRMSDWLYEEVYRIIDYRYAQNLPTVVATNLGPGELHQHFGDRIVRRLRDMTEPFELA